MGSAEASETHRERRAMGEEGIMHQELNDSYQTPRQHYTVTEKRIGKNHKMNPRTTTTCGTVKKKRVEKTTERKGTRGLNRNGGGGMCRG